MKTTELTATFNHSFQISMTLAQALSGSHQGSCDADVAQLVRTLDLSDCDPDDIREELKETGAWDDEELADDEQNKHRIVWHACCNIRDEWNELDPAVRALAMHLDCDPADISEERYDHYGMTVYSAEGGEYAVATDEEADAAWDASLDSYIEECINPEIDKLDVGNLSAYIKFDVDMWKRDARVDGRGHSLSSYDGNENEETVEGVTYYIYRTN